MNSIMKTELSNITHKLSLVTGIFLVLFCRAGFAQVEEQSMRYALSDEGVYLYHLEQVPLGVGFHIYKKEEGQDEFEKLNEGPVQGVFYPDELLSFLGETYWEVEDALETTSERDTFFSLRSNSILGSLYTFVYPEVAEALGRLYIDPTTKPGDNVTYKIEFVNDLGRPTGKVLEETFTIEPVEPPQPQNIELSNDGYAMEIKWTYPPMENEDDKIIRFEIYESDPGNNELNLINEQMILRDDLKTDYLHFFSVSRLGVEKEYLVAPVSITGERTSVSELISYTVVDNIPPKAIEGVRAERVEEAVEVTWPMSPETDLAGYKIYRTIDPTLGVDLLQEELIDPDQTVFIDTTAAEGEAYLYQITAVDEAGNEGKLSGPSLMTIEDRTPPPAPQSLDAEFLEDGNVRVFWNPGEMAPDFSRFLVYRRSISPTDSTIYDLISDDNFRDTEFFDDGVSDLGFQEGMFYEYGVSVADSSRNFSEIITVRLQIPDRTSPNAPTSVFVENMDGNRVDINWPNSSSGDVVTYLLFREQRDGGRILLDSTAVTDRSFRDETVEVGNEYRYGISAVDSLRNESEPTFSRYLFVKKNDPISRVRNVRIVQRNESPELYWEPVSSQHLVGYMVYRSDISTGIYEPVNSEPIIETIFPLEDQEPGYWYRVRALDVSGNESRASEPVRYTGQ
jgi:fibronectin type 3 domain-containing protein